jgi:nucleotide sugar dehydrogenase
MRWGPGESDFTAPDIASQTGKLKNLANVKFEQTPTAGFELNKMKIAVLGLGQIGLPVAQYIHSKDLEVYGYDINTITVERVCETEEFAATTQWNDIPEVDAYVICVTTTQKDFRPDLSPVFDVCKLISSKAKLDSLVSIESTIIPGTCRKIFETILAKKVKLVHAPHRYWPAQPEKHGVNQLRVLGGINQESLNAGLKFYKDTLGIPMHTVSSVEIAEMCKITENAHRYLQIAFAEELKMMCSKIGMNFDELRQALNTKWNVDLPEARQGIGGPCLPKDMRYVTSVAPSEILESALNVDKKYREWLSKTDVS